MFTPSSPQSATDITDSAPASGATWRPPLAGEPDRLQPDQISRPPHYTFSPIEPIKVIRSWRLNFALGNVIKYLARAGRKDSTTRLEDLQKARWYLDEEIAFWERESSAGVPAAKPAPGQRVSACDGRVVNY